MRSVERTEYYKRILIVAHNLYKKEVTRKNAIVVVTIGDIIKAKNIEKHILIKNIVKEIEDNEKLGIHRKYLKLVEKLKRF